jgi:glutamyl-tRNA synthetase
VERALPFLAAGLTREKSAASGFRQPTADDLRPLIPMVRERLPTLAEITDMVDYLFVEDLVVDPASLVPKRWDVATTAEALTAARGVIASVGPVSFEADELEGPLRNLAEERGWKVGDLFMAIRVAVTGRTATPPLFDVLVALGYERTLQRIDQARELLATAVA